MKLRRLYSNKAEVFQPVVFHDGLNVVLGEIRLPENRNKDTHNLGKSILARLIDFCLLMKRDKDFFLFKHTQLFSDFVFLLEVQNHRGDLITIRRSVAQPSKASFFRHVGTVDDLSDMPANEWSHWEVPFDKAKEILDGLLDLTAIAPWGFRNAIGYSLRSQRDYDEPFKLAKYGGAHSEWKPLLAHILGLNSQLVKRNYDLADSIADAKRELERVRAELVGVDNYDQLKGLIDIRRNEIVAFEEELDNYDFALADAEINRELVERLDVDIASLNERRYYLTSSISRTREALSKGVNFELDKVEKVFRQAGIYFGDQIRKDFTAVTAFNRAISDERNSYLRKELSELERELALVTTELTELNGQRSTALLILKDEEVFSKFKRVSKALVLRQAELESLHRQLAAVEGMQTIRRTIDELASEQARVGELIRENLENPGERYATIRAYFNEVIKRVIDRNGVLFTVLNDEGNVEFKVDILDASGRRTSQGEGFTYGRLLCVAFDVAVARAYAADAYPHFLYHDGGLETLDDRKKLNLIEVIREYSTALGLQHIITMIDSELPQLPNGETFGFEANEVIAVLHDEGEKGLLFRMRPW